MEFPPRSKNKSSCSLQTFSGVSEFGFFTESEFGGVFPVDWRDTFGEYISQSLNNSAIFFEGFKVRILVSPNQRCYQQQKGPVRLSARDPSERFSTLLTRLQSQQLAGVQCRSARYEFSGIGPYCKAKNTVYRCASIVLAWR